VYVLILAWDLTDSPVTFAELRSWVANKAAADYSKMPGARIKTWFSNEQKRTWGAVYVVDSPDVIHPDRLPRLPQRQDWTNRHTTHIILLVRHGSLRNRTRRPHRTHISRPVNGRHLDVLTSDRLKIYQTGSRSWSQRHHRNTARARSRRPGLHRRAQPRPRHGESVNVRWARGRCTASFTFTAWVKSSPRLAYWFWTRLGRAPGGEGSVPAQNLGHGRAGTEVPVRTQDVENA
jgi:hypothetical protein